MRVGIYPGSFDPITVGHIDIIKRATNIVDKLIVAVLMNNSKKALFNIDERIDMINNSIKEIENVEVISFSGLLIELAKKKNASIIIRGLRAVSDYEYELQLAHTNKILYNDIDTIFLLSDNKYSYLSSSVVKEIASYNGDVSKFVNSYVETKIKNKYKNV